ncbi:hypothetical protein P3L10_022568 [Capsicum annuum]
MEMNFPFRRCGILLNKGNFGKFSKRKFKILTQDSLFPPTYSHEFGIFFLPSKILQPMEFEGMKFLHELIEIEQI